MNSITWSAFGFSILALGLTLQTKVPMIDTSLPECDRRMDSLFCDFQDSSINTIYLGHTNETVGIIYVYNIAELHLNLPICTNLALNNIGKVEIEETELDLCNQTIKLTAKDTLLSKIPRNAEEIDLENCTLLSLTTVYSLTKANILNSHIEVLNVSEPSIKVASLTVDGSSIGILQKLALNGSEFSMKSTKIEFISPGGLVVQHGLAKLENCSLQNVSADSFWIYPNATLMLENISGNFRAPHTGKTSNGRLFVVENTEDKKDFFTEFVIVLSILVITMASCLGIILVHFIKKRTRSRKNGGKFQNKDEQIALLEKKLSEKNRSIKGLAKNQKRGIVTNSLLVDDSLPTHEGAAKGGDVSLAEKQFSLPSCHQSQPTNEGAAKRGDVTLTEKQLSVPSFRQSHPTHERAAKGGDVSLTEKQFSSPSCHQSETKQEDTVKEGDVALTKEQLTAPCPDNLSDKVIIFNFYSLSGQEFDIADVLKKDRIKIVLKESTYGWEEIKEKLLSRKRYLSEFQVIQVTATEFHSIRNGATLSTLSKKIRALLDLEGEMKKDNVILTKKQFNVPLYHQSLPTNKGALKGGDVTLTEKQLSSPPYHQSQPTHEGTAKEGDFTLTEKQLSSLPYHQPQPTHKDAVKEGDFTLTEKQLSSPPYHQSQPTHKGAAKEGDFTLTEKQLSSPPYHQSRHTHEDAAKEGDVTLTEKQLSSPPYHQSQPTHKGAAKEGDFTLTEKQLSSPPYHQSRHTHEGAAKEGDVTLTEKQLSSPPYHQFQPTHKGAAKEGDFTLTGKQLSSPPYHQSRHTHEGAAKEGDVTLTEKQLSSPPYHQSQPTHKGAVKEGDFTLTEKQLSSPPYHQSRHTHEGAAKEGDFTLTGKQLSSPPYHQSQPKHKGAAKEGDITLTEKQLSSPPYHQSQPTHEGAVKEGDVTLTNKELTLPPYHQPQTKQEDAAKEGDFALTKEQPTVKPYHHSPDNLSDKVIIFKPFSLAGQESDIADALRRDKIRIGLKENTYDWEEIEEKLLSRKRSLSEFQVMKVTTTEFLSIQNGETFSALTKKVPSIQVYLRSKSDFPTSR
ncbi:uncharacterized protein [Macrobrachium rosenbergii]